MREYIQWIEDHPLATHVVGGVVTVFVLALVVVPLIRKVD